MNVPSSIPLSGDNSVKKPKCATLAIDWSLAEPLSTAGTTCDTFRYVYNNRVYFLKRLKKGLEVNSRYLDAIRKEFEVGRKLEHPSLPNYESEHDEKWTWFATRYVDGRTLTELISKQDPWLAKKENVRKMLTELLDVVAYLHAHGVTHSDIHAGNVMLDRTHTLKLIDLGLCYTDWAPKSSGHPSHIGINDDEKGSPLIDFRMTGDFTQQLIEAYPTLRNKRFSKFIAACKRDDVTAEILKEILNKPQPTNKRNLWIWSSIGLAMVLIVGIVLVLRRDQTPEGIMTQEPQTDTTVITMPTTQSAPIVEEQQIQVPTPASLLRSRLTGELPTAYRPLDEAINETISAVRDTTISDSDILDAQSRIIELSTQILLNAIQKYGDEFPSLSSTEIHGAIVSTAVFESYSRRINEVSAIVLGEIKRRHPLDYAD